MSQADLGVIWTVSEIKEAYEKIRSGDLAWLFVEYDSINYTKGYLSKTGSNLQEFVDSFVGKTVAMGYIRIQRKAMFVQLFEKMIPQDSLDRLARNGKSFTKDFLPVCSLSIVIKNPMAISVDFIVKELTVKVPAPPSTSSAPIVDKKSISNLANDSKSFASDHKITKSLDNVAAASRSASLDNIMKSKTKRDGTYFIPPAKGLLGSEFVIEADPHFEFKESFFEQLALQFSKEWPSEHTPPPVIANQPTKKNDDFWPADLDANDPPLLPVKSMSQIKADINSIGSITKSTSLSNLPQYQGSQQLKILNQSRLPSSNSLQEIEKFSKFKTAAEESNTKKELYVYHQSPTESSPSKRWLTIGKAFLSLRVEQSDKFPMYDIAFKNVVSITPRNDSTKSIELSTYKGVHLLYPAQNLDLMEIIQSLQV